MFRDYEVLDNTDTNAKKSSQNRGSFIDEPNVVANLLKNILRELEEPLVEYVLLDKFLELKKYNTQTKKRSIGALVSKMHEVNRNTLMLLISFLRKFIEVSEDQNHITSIVESFAVIAFNVRLLNPYDE
jgi:hypothetical protein